MTVQELPSVQQLQQLLLQLTVPDTQAIRVASASLKRVLSLVGCVERLLDVLTSSNEVAARQLAAVYLRKRIGAHWIKLTAHEKASTQSLLLQRLISEPARPVKIAIAGVITVVARYTLPNNEWPDLLPYLEQACQPSSQVRELGLRIFRVLAQTVSKPLRSNVSTLCQIFKTGLDDADVNVRLEALKALGTLAQLLEEDEAMKWFQAILAPMVNAMRSCVDAGFSDAAIVALEVLEDVAENPTDVIGAQLGALVMTVLGLARSADVEMEVRERAATLVGAMLAHRPMQIAAHPELVLEILNTSLHLMVEGCAVDSDADEPDEMVEGARGAAVSVMDTAMLHLPVKATYTHMLNSVVGLTRAESPLHRRAGFFTLMVMTEGAASAMEANFDDLLKLVLAGLEDSVAPVREAACLALGQLADHLSEALSSAHSVSPVLQTMLRCFDRPDQAVLVKVKLCLALESLCAELGEDLLAPFLTPLMQRLLALVHSPQQILQEAAVGAISAVASAAGEKFLPFTKDTLTLMMSAMSQTSEELFSLRAKATFCTGAVAAAVGAQHIAASTHAFMELSLKGFQLDSCSLRENTFGFWSLMARVLGDGFAQYLGTIVDLCIASIESDDGMNFRNESADLDKEFGGAGDDGGDDDDDDDDEEFSIGDEDDDSGRIHCSILSGFLDEKVAAVDCLGSAMKFSGRAATPHVERVLDVLQVLTNYPHHSVRGTVLRALHDMALTVLTLSPNSSDSQAVVDHVVSVLALLMSEDDSRDIASAAADAVLSLAKKLGPAPLQKHLENVMRSANMLLSNEGACQQFDQDSERDSVTESVCDLLGGLAQTYQHAFMPLFRGVMPALGGRFDGADDSTKSVVLGCLGEVVEAIAGETAVFAKKIADIALDALANSPASDRLTRNAAFCLGALFGSLPAAATSSQHSAAFNVLNRLLNEDSGSDEGVPPTTLAARDNVVSALCKLVKCVDGAGVDMNAALGLLLKHLPLRVDMDETRFVYPVLLQVWHGAARPNEALPRLVHVLSAVLADERVQAETKNLVGSGLLDVLHRSGALSQLDSMSLSPSQRNAVRALLQQAQA